MAVGDDASDVGYSLVPPTTEEGLVKWGYREINRTRDFVAQLKKILPVTKGGFRTATGITSSTAIPSNSTGENGDIHFRTL